ncbi:MAG: hypothetical protein ACI3T9_04400 [Romboutsia timonensis]
MSNLDIKMAELNKKYKAQIINKGTDIIEVSKIPFSSPTANYMTYGGIPVGKITEFYGGEGGGKTTSALDIVKNAQIKFNTIYFDKVEALEEQIAELDAKKATKLQTELDELKEQGPKVVVYVDTEMTLDTEWAQLLGVQTDQMILVRPEAQTAEQVFQIILDLIGTGNVGLVVLDSIPMLVSQNVYDESMEKKAYCGISQPLTMFCSKVTPLLTKYQCAFIGINQIREDVGSLFSTESTPGGRGWKHACTLRLKFKKGNFFDVNGNDTTRGCENPAGNKVQIEIIKSKCCKSDRRLGYYTLNYTEGIDIMADSVTIGQQYGIIVKAGSWYRIMTDEGEIKIAADGTQLSFQGFPKLCAYLEDNEEELEDLLNRLEKVMS